eukprot:1161373-Pelagomonas_calceolata.AAC.8
MATATSSIAYAAAAAPAAYALHVGGEWGWLRYPGERSSNFMLGAGGVIGVGSPPGQSPLQYLFHIREWEGWVVEGMVVVICPRASRM